MADSPFPCVSVIVPVYNGPTGIRNIPAALTEQTYPIERVNILPIDSGPIDETHDVICQFERGYENATFVVKDEIRGSYAARNTGMEQVTGEIFVFADADMYVDELWLEAAVDAVDETAYIGYDVEPVTNGEDTPPARLDVQTAFPIA